MKSVVGHEKCLTSVNGGWWEVPSVKKTKYYPCSVGKLAASMVELWVVYSAMILMPQVKATWWRSF